MIKGALQQIGLTDGEIRVYLALLELGSTSTGKITKDSGISGSKVYEVLDRLMHKGLATYVIKNGVKYFAPTQPEKILDYLDEKGKDTTLVRGIFRKKKSYTQGGVIHMTYTFTVNYQ